MVESSSATCAVILGVSASGKSAVAKALAAEHPVIYVDADDSHTDEAKAKMSRGEPLTDADRAPWLVAVAKSVSAALTRAEHRVVALACSALTRDLRATLRQEVEARAEAKVVYAMLHVPRAVVEERLEARVGGGGGHFFAGKEMADTQFEALEPLEPGPCALVVDASPGNAGANSPEKTAALVWEFIKKQRSLDAR
jgi:gluconokinase